MNETGWEKRAWPASQIKPEIHTRRHELRHTGQCGARYSSHVPVTYLYIQSGDTTLRIWCIFLDAAGAHTKVRLKTNDWLKSAARLPLEPDQAF